MKEKFNLIDDLFSHDKYSVAGRDSEYIEWNRHLNDFKIPTFYSHNRMIDIDNLKTLKENSYGLLFESMAIVPFIYSKVENYIPKFKTVFTHNSYFLNKYSNCSWIPGGGIWVGGTYGKGEIGIKEKSKMCSFVSSTKQMCDLHIFRLNLARKLNNSQVDVFGLDHWRPIHETLDDYMFSIIIENYQDDLYFTEKLLNCFATGTIPIYFGAKNIGKKFNIDGILIFNNTHELKEQLSKLSNELYHKKMKAVEDNFNLCLKYKSLEDYIYKKYMLDV